jgi:hypothetical protein
MLILQLIGADFALSDVEAKVIAPRMNFHLQRHRGRHANALIL